jgi:hypothetical protein
VPGIMILNVKHLPLVLQVLFCVYTSTAFSQEPSPADAFATSSHTLRFQAQGYPVRLGAEAAVIHPDAPPIAPSASPDAPRRSPVLAGALSLVLPGAGETYAGSYLLGAAFLALEAAGWFFAIRYNGRGDDATISFQNYADAHWSVVRYAQWLNSYAKNFDGSEDRLTQIPIDLATPGLSDWQRVDWGTMNKVESAIPVFSHRLPTHGEQQYFELVGKYDQYSYGWDDKVTISDGWSDYRTISRNFHDYSLQRDDANSLYKTASTFASLIVVNHVLSAADAAWAAVRFNKHVDFHTRVLPRGLPDGSIELVPTASFAWVF